MDKIRIGLICDHKLILDGISALLEDLDGIRILVTENSIDRLLQFKDLNTIQILIVNFPVLDSRVMEITAHLKFRNPKIQVLIFSSDNNENGILKTIKAGARGFLSADSDRGDLIEAIYTLRNGHDYYSKSITQLLLQKYISDLKSEGSPLENNSVSMLSTRELEILKLWGNSLTNVEISEKLFISIRTVESHKNHIMQKLNLKTAVDLVKFAIRNNIIDV